MSTSKSLLTITMLRSREILPKLSGTYDQNEESKTGKLLKARI